MPQNWPTIPWPPRTSSLVWPEAHKARKASLGAAETPSSVSMIRAALSARFFHQAPARAAVSAATVGRCLRTPALPLATGEFTPRSRPAGHCAVGFAWRSGRRLHRQRDLLLCLARDEHNSYVSELYRYFLVQVGRWGCQLWRRKDSGPETRLRFRLWTNRDVGQGMDGRKARRRLGSHSHHLYPFCLDWAADLSSGLSTFSAQLHRIRAVDGWGSDL